MTAVVNLTGKKIGRWLVLERADNRCGRVAWLCRCLCGTERVVTSASLVRSKSCGCWKHEVCAGRRGQKNPSYKHGRTNTRTFGVWTGMLDRCYNKKGRNYGDYGGRGIDVCERWRGSFANFLADMGEAPPGMTLDRKNGKLGYSPENCRWATWSQQNRNRPGYNRMIEHDGESLSMAEWAERAGVPYQLFRQRVYAGWSMHRAMTTPHVNEVRKACQTAPKPWKPSIERSDPRALGG